MKSTVRPELSKSNRYWIEKNRYYELKYFCLQYQTWKRQYEELDGFSGRSIDAIVYSKLNNIANPTHRTAEERSLYLERMEVIEQSAIEADPYLASYILKAVTEGHSYTYLKSRLDVPCSRDMYYDRYRRFFWILDQKRK